MVLVAGEEGCVPTATAAPGRLGSGAIAATAVVACVAIAGFLGWCVYYS
jgi:hypothetical protein